MKKRLYISSLWMATLFVLLSTVMMHHHHHLSEVCTIVEQCAIDGEENDEHTGHHESEGEENGCAIQQMHSFIINAKTTNVIHHSFLPLPYPLPIALPWDCHRLLTADSFYTLLYYKEPSTALAFAERDGIKRRGPPLVRQS